MGVQIRLGKGTYEGTMLVFSCMLPSTLRSGPDDQRCIGRLQKQMSVTLNFPNEKSPLAVQPVVKIL